MRTRGDIAIIGSSGAPDYDAWTVKAVSTNEEMQANMRTWNTATKTANAIDAMGYDVEYDGDKGISELADFIQNMHIALADCWDDDVIVHEVREFMQAIQKEE